MSTGEQPLTDGWDIRRDNDGKGQDSCSDRKGCEAGVNDGEEVGADAQDDETEAENDAWKSPEQRELVSRSREARRGVSGMGDGVLRTENGEADDVEGLHIISS